MWWRYGNNSPRLGRVDHSLRPKAGFGSFRPRSWNEVCRPCAKLAHQSYHIIEWVSNGSALWPAGVIDREISCERQWYVEFLYRFESWLDWIFLLLILFFRTTTLQHGKNWTKALLRATIIQGKFLMLIVLCYWELSPKKIHNGQFHRHAVKKVVCWLLFMFFFILHHVCILRGVCW